jgi:hypothetical protein
MNAPNFGIVMSHAPGFTARWDVVDDARQATLTAGVERARALVAEAEPDLIIAFVNDHFHNFTLKGMPPFCIGVGDVHEAPGAAAAEMLRIPERTIAGEPEVAMQLLECVMAAGFDPAFSAELSLFDDLSVPLYKLYGPERSLPPVIPIVTNCIAPPMPSFGRCYDLGAAIGYALETIDAPYERVMVLGSGGLSHWVGTPRTSEINGEFDAAFLAQMRAGNIEEMRMWNDVEIDEVAGNGALELKNWILALAALGPFTAQQLAYAAVPEWLTGMAIFAVTPHD